MLKSTALSYFKDVTALANTLNIRTQAISQWGEVVPELRAHQLEKITKGALKVDHSVYCSTPDGAVA